MTDLKFRRMSDSARGPSTISVVVTVTLAVAIALVWQASGEGRAKADPSAGERSASVGRPSGYVDPQAFCAATGTTADLVFRSTYPQYKGLDRAPAWMLRALRIVPDEARTANVMWRCKNGRVLACQAGMSNLNAQICFQENGRWPDSNYEDVTAAAEPQSYSLPVAPTGGVHGFLDPSYNYGEAQSNWRQHLGIDLPAAPGTPVISPVDGTVIYNLTSGVAAESAFIVIEETLTGVQHVLGHIDSPIRPGTPGAAVRRGQVVGSVKRWPTANGGSNSHVHWGLNDNRVDVSVQQDSVGAWGWGRGPFAATEAQVSEHGWVDPSNFVARAQGAFTANGSSSPSLATTVPATELSPAEKRCATTAASDRIFRDGLPAVAVDAAGPAGLVGRCQDRRVMVCMPGASDSVSKCQKLSARAPMAVTLWCSDRTMTGPVPTIYSSGSASTWRCSNGTAVATSRIEVDERGFAIADWVTLRPRPGQATVAAAAVPVAPVNAAVRVPNACPFEGCQLGAWRATASVQVFAAVEGRPTVKLGRGDRVTALEAEVRAVPRRAVVTDLSDYERGQGLRVGSVVGVLHPGGEGAVVVLFQDRIVQGSMDLRLRYDRSPDVEPLQWSWWVRLRLPSGATGWVKDPQQQFDGMDQFS